MRASDRRTRAEHQGGPVRDKACQKDRMGTIGGPFMKKYEYVSVHIATFFGARSEEHRQIIDEYAKKGYRYVG